MSGYCAASDVGILVQNILGGEPIFSTATSPNSKAVNSWITTGCAVIDTHLLAAGYAVPIASTTALYGMLIRCNALFTVARVEESRTNMGLAPNERTRGQVFDEQFDDCLSTLTTMDLTLAGATRTSIAPVYAGGISISDKQANEADTNRVPPRFSRDQFAFPGTVRPGSGTAS